METFGVLSFLGGGEVATESERKKLLYLQCSRFDSGIIHEIIICNDLSVRAAAARLVRVKENMHARAPLPPQNK